jgi:hypothetical protein
VSRDEYFLKAFNNKGTCNDSFFQFFVS